MTVYSVIPLLLLLCSSSAVGLRLGDPAAYVKPVTQYQQRTTTRTGYNGHKYQVEYLETPLDHFSFSTNRTFLLRYFFNDQYFQCGKPIFFYTGNEGNLEGFEQNTGFMYDAAPEFQAAVIFAEHRFYGQTKPFGNDSYAKVENLGYLSSEQALADFAYLIHHLKTKRLKCSSRSAVIAFGGSYGGMLAAWIRVKYPHLVQGAIAGSAPVFWFLESDIPYDTYQKITTRTFVNSGCDRKAVEAGWAAVENLAKTDSGRAYLNELFRLEEKSRLNKPEDYSWLRAFIREVFEGMVMVDYPYPSNFIADLPGWPVKKACKFLATPAKTDEKAAEALYNVVNIYYNNSGKTSTFCANSATCTEGAFAQLGDPLGWPWQTCTEMFMPICATGEPNDFFWNDGPCMEAKFVLNCRELFGKIGYDRSLSRPNWVTTNYGAKTFPTATNIVFSNGYLDPWSGGGWSLEDKQEGSLVGVILKEGAHHYDLRGAHPDDTDEVKKVRELEKTNMRKWVKEYEMEWKTSRKAKNSRRQ